MLASQPPYDRAIVLPCRMSIFRDRWFSVTCACGHTAHYPVRQMLIDDSGAGARTLAETVVRARCRDCGGRPTTIHLTEDGRGPGPIIGGPVEPGWSILLHGEPG
jgi:hypothetical protein